jgi:murein DD-endopeptidase MepM/ murein hydrolase activator NlpD
MRTTGTILLIAHGIFLLFAAVFFGASFGAFLGEAPMIVSGLLTMLLWGVYGGFTVYAMRLSFRTFNGDSASVDGALTWSNRLFIAAIILFAATGLPLAFGTFASCGPLYLPELYHWTGLAGSALAFVAFYLLPFFARPAVGSPAEGQTGPHHGRAHAWWTLLTSVLPVYAIWGVFWIVVYSLLSGSIDESKYPKAEYELPYPKGESSWVIQGNSSGFNHSGNEEFAYDFRRPCGTPVIAARKGTVTKVVDSNDGHGENNMIEVTHDDKTVGRYLHIKKGSARVKKNDNVKRGQELAKVGNVGNSLTGHIHFVVEKGGKSIPIKFSDVSSDKGIPRTFSSYTSGNDGK